jgi:ferredoxin
MDELTEKAWGILPEGGDEKCIEEAMAMCPGDCISLENGG